MLKIYKNSAESANALHRTPTSNRGRWPSTNICGRIDSKVTMLSSYYLILAAMIYLPFVNLYYQATEELEADGPYFILVFLLVQLSLAIGTHKLLRKCDSGFVLNNYNPGIICMSIGIFALFLGRIGMWAVGEDQMIGNIVLLISHLFLSIAQGLTVGIPCMEDEMSYLDCKTEIISSISISTIFYLITFNVHPGAGGVVYNIFLAAFMSELLIYFKMNSKVVDWNKIVSL